MAMDLGEEVAPDMMDNLEDELEPAREGINFGAELSNKISDGIEAGMKMTEREEDMAIATEELEVIDEFSEEDIEI